MANDELMIDVLRQIEKEPQHWHQGWWANRSRSCGTTYCFAGWACILTGHEIRWGAGNLISGVVVGGSAVPTTAREELELTQHQASVLFHDTATAFDSLYDTCAWIMGIDAEVLREKVLG